MGSFHMIVILWMNVPLHGVEHCGVVRVSGSGEMLYRLRLALSRSHLSRHIVD